MLWLEHLMNLFKIFQWSWFCLFSHQKSEISHVAAIIQQDVSPAILSLEFLHRMLFISVLHVWKFCWDSLIIWNFLEFQWLILFLHPSSPPFFIIFQVSREHYQRVKNSMKHNSNSIQPRSLSNVLGDMENLHVQPFEFYEEEERQKLHDHWLVLWSKTFLLVYQCFPYQFIVCLYRLHLANRDVPAGFANWIQRRSQGLQVRKSLGQEMEQKLKVQIKVYLRSASYISKFPESPELSDNLFLLGLSGGRGKDPWWDLCRTNWY